MRYNETGDDMKILLYTEGLKAISKSGLGKAIKHQKKALEDNKIDYTTNLKEDYDILHINFYGPKSYFYAKKAKRNGKRIVYHAHSTEEDFRNSFHFSNLISPLFKKWLIKCYTLGDYIITPTEYSKRLLLNYHMDRPIKAISNGVDTKFFEKNEEKGKEFRKTYGYQDDDKVIVGIGLYIKRKGILDFVELAKRLPEYKFIWFGYSPLWASPREIKRAVNTKLPNLCFAGYVEPPMIKAALSGANLYLFPTLEETEGIPIIEALTSKIPTLIRDIPVFEEYEDKKVVYKAKNIDDFERMIPKILNGELPDLTEEGYKEAKKKDIKTVGRQLVQTYEEVLKLPIDEEKRKEERKTSTHKKIFVVGILFLLLLMTAVLFATRNSEGKEKSSHLETYSASFEAMDTTISIKVYSDSSSKAKEALEYIESLYQKYDQLTSREEGGELYAIFHNSEDKDRITIDEDLYVLLRYSVNWYEKSQGYLNVNIGNIVDVWAPYRISKDGIPTADELSTIGDTDITNVTLLGNNEIANTNPNIDLEYIRLGYTTKLATDYLEENGISAYLIQAGTVIAVGDYYETDGKYVLVVASPFKENDVDALTNVHLTNGAIAVKGIYQDYYEYEGTDYGYIFDANTYYPASNMVGVTVVAEDPALADALATTLFLMTVPEGQEYIQNFENVGAMWAYKTSDGVARTVITENFYDYK